MSDQIALMRRASFGGFQFPWNRIQISGSLRHHVHEYPHQPGGEIEELGRKLYEFKFSSDFHDTMFGWPNVYPEQLGKLRRKFEEETTEDLVIPNFGTVRAKCIKWDQTLVAKARSGESVEFTFLENTQNAFSIGFILGSSTAAMLPAVARLQQIAAAQGIKSGLFADLESAVGDLATLVQKGQLVGAVAYGKVKTVLNLCADIESLPILNKAGSYPTANANRDVWASANKVSVDMLRRDQPLQTFFVDHTMSIVDVSLAIFGDTLHAMEILQLNDLDDAMALPPGTLVKHYQPPAALAA